MKFFGIKLKFMKFIAFKKHDHEQHISYSP